SFWLMAPQSPAAGPIVGPHRAGSRAGRASPKLLSCPGETPLHEDRREGEPGAFQRTDFRRGQQCLKPAGAQEVYQRPDPNLVEIRIKIVHQEQRRLSMPILQEAELPRTQGYHRGS